MAISDVRPPPLDELVWQSNEAVANVGGSWGVHDNNVLYYFAESPFFDRTSNNQIVRTQAEMPGRERMIETRHAFEGELRKRSGLEFVVAHAQTDFGHQDLANSQGRWVIHKQRRTKKPGAEDKVDLLATYFVLGDLIYMAPSVGDILWNRMDTFTLQMKSFMGTMAGLACFTPASGYSYADSPSAVDVAGKMSAPSSAMPSRSASPTPGPLGSDDIVMTGTQESRTGHNGPSSDFEDGLVSTDPQDLVESFRTFLQYRHEYMNEVPLVGEPGSFSFASKPMSKSQSQTSQPRQPKGSQTTSSEATSVSATQESFRSDASKTSKDETQSSAASAPPPLKLKRRKSKAPTSPSSPLSPSGPQSPMSAAPSPGAS